MQAKLTALETFLAKTNDTDPAELKERCLSLGLKFPSVSKTRAKSTQAERLPYREYAISDSGRARVGRGAADNDKLTLKHTTPNDLWLHVRSMHGSHVSVPMGRGQTPSSELLIDAAHLAAHFSEASKDGDVEVMYTQRRYVRKPKGAPPGSVQVLREKTILVRIEEKRLDRLLKNRVQ